MIAVAYGRGWPQWQAGQIAALVAIIGAIHETTEIFTYSHTFETKDVIVNAIGALFGVAVQRATRRV